MRTRVRGVAAAALLLLALCACDGEAHVVVATTSIDTLADGAIRVVNTSEGLWDTAGAEPWELVEDLRTSIGC